MKKPLAIWRELISMVRLGGEKIIHPRGLFFRIKQDISFSTRFYFEEVWGGKIYLGDTVHIKRNVELNVSPGAVIRIGDNTCINNNCYIGSLKSVTIGNRCEFGPNVIVVDHDHDFRAPNGIRDRKYIIEDVTIGDDVWIGANSVILKGTVLGNGCVVGAGSVIHGVYDDNTVIYSTRDVEIKPYQRRM